MTRFRTLSPLAALLAAASFSIPAAGRAGDRPQPLFHRLRPVQPRGRDRSADQPRRTHHRLCPQVQRHHDRQGAADHLAGRRRDRPAAPAESPARAPIRRRAGRPTEPASPMSPRRAATRNFTSAGWQAAKARASPAFPTARTAIAWSPDGRRIAYSMFVPDEGMTLGSAPPKPEGAKWADPLADHQCRHLPLRWRRLFQARLYADLLGPRRRRLADAADVWRDQCRRRPDRLDSRQPLGAVQRQPQQELGTRAQRKRDLSRQHRWRNAGCADQPKGSRRVARGLSRRTPDRLCRLRRRRPLVPRIPSCR